MHVIQQQNISLVQHGFTVRLGEIQKQLEEVTSLLKSMEGQEVVTAACTPSKSVDSEIAIAASNQIMQLTQDIDTTKGLLQPMQIRIASLEKESFELKSQMEGALKASSITGGRCNELHASVSQWENKINIPTTQAKPQECNEVEEKLTVYINNLDLITEVKATIGRIYSSLAGDMVDEEVELIVQERLESQLEVVRDAVASIPTSSEPHGSNKRNSDLMGQTWTPREVGMTVTQIQSVASLLWARESSRWRQECYKQLQDISQNFDDSLEKGVLEAKEYCIEKLQAKSKAAASSSSAGSDDKCVVSHEPPLSRPDYALMGAGARVVSHLTSPTYTPPSTNPLLTSVLSILGMETGVGGPQEALSQDTTVGHCWAMEVCALTSP